MGSNNDFEDEEDDGSQVGSDTGFDKDSAPDTTLAQDSSEVDIDIDDLNNILYMDNSKNITGCAITYYPEVYKLQPALTPFVWHFNPNDYDPEKFFKNVMTIFLSKDFSSDKTLVNKFQDFLALCTRLPRDTINKILSSPSDTKQWANTIGDNIKAVNSQSFSVGMVEGDKEPGDSEKDEPNNAISKKVLDQNIDDDDHVDTMDPPRTDTQDFLQ